MILFCIGLTSRPLPHPPSATVSRDLTPLTHSLAGDRIAAQVFHTASVSATKPGIHTHIHTTPHHTTYHLDTSLHVPKQPHHSPRQQKTATRAGLLPSDQLVPGITKTSYDKTRQSERHQTRQRQDQHKNRPARHGGKHTKNSLYRSIHTHTQTDRRRPFCRTRKVSPSCPSQPAPAPAHPTHPKELLSPEPQASPMNPTARPLRSLIGEWQRKTKY